MATRRTGTAASPRVGKRRPPGLALHAAMSPRERNAAVDAFRATLTERLDAEHAALVSETELRAAADAPMRALLASQAPAARARATLGRLFEVERKRGIRSFHSTAISPPRFHMEIAPGIEVIAPPYDLQWHTAFSQSSKADGVFNVAALLGYEASGLGVLLSSAVAAAVSFRPVVPFRYLWVNSATQAACSSRGGLGMLVYRNGEATPLIDRQHVLWSDYRDAYSPLAKGSDDGYFATEFSPGDLLLPVEAGDSFRIWIWCWSTAHAVNSAGKVALSTGFIECRMPFIVVDTGPPLPPVR